MYHIFMGITLSNCERFQETFLDFFIFIFNNDKKPQIEVQHFAILKCYQAIRNTGYGRKVLSKHFKKRGNTSLDETINHYINQNFFLFYTVSKNIEKDNLFCQLLNDLFKDIFYKLVTYLGPLSLWNLTIESLPSLFADVDIPNTKVHPHPLNDFGELNDWICDGNVLRNCTVKDGQGPRYRCRECEFNLCEECYRAYEIKPGNADDDANEHVEKSGDDSGDIGLDFFKKLEDDSTKSDKEEGSAEDPLLSV